MKISVKGATLSKSKAEGFREHHRGESKTMDSVHSKTDQQEVAGQPLCVPVVRAKTSPVQTSQLEQTARELSKTMHKTMIWTLH